MMGVPTPTHPEDLDVSDATFHSPDLTTFCRWTSSASSWSGNT